MNACITHVCLRTGQQTTDRLAYDAVRFLLRGQASWSRYTSSHRHLLRQQRLLGDGRAQALVAGLLVVEEGLLEAQVPVQGLDRRDSLLAALAVVGLRTNETCSIKAWKQQGS